MAKNLKEQQKAFDAFRYDFNHYRPHEALDNSIPGDYYKKSNRPLPKRLYQPEYGADFKVRIVNKNGCVKLSQCRYYLTE